MMFVAGRLVGKIQPKYLIAVGAVVIALSMYALTNVYGDLGFWFMARSRMLFAAGIPFIPHSPDEAAILRAPRPDSDIRFSIIDNVGWGGDGGPDG